MQNFKHFNHAQHCKQFTMTTPSTREDINSDSDTVSTETTSEQDPDEINALSEKQGHLQFWNQQLKFKRIEFWNMIKNAAKAKIYNTWLNSGPKTLPRKLQIPTIREESKNQRVRRERLAMEEFKAELDLLQVWAKFNADKYQSNDNKVNSFFKNKTSGELKTQIFFKLILTLFKSIY